MRSADLRNRPRQQRSLDRMNTILEAASAVFAEVGYEAATTNAIAARAGTSIGSLYRFFPDKLAIFKALSHRFMDKIGSLIQSELAPEVQSQPMSRIAAKALELFERFNIEEPAFARLLIFMDSSPELAEIDRSMRQLTAVMLSTLMAAKGLKIPPERRMVAAYTLIQIMDSYFRCRQFLPMDQAEDVRAEYTTLLVAYIGFYL